MPNRRSRPNRLPLAAALGAALILVAGCNRLGAQPASQNPGPSQAAAASQPAAAAPTPTAGPTHGPLPSFDADLGSIDAALNGTNDALGAAGSATSEGNLK